MIMNKFQFVLAAVPIAFVVGCSNPADSVPEAKVSKASNTVATSSAASGKRFALHPENSKIEFTGSKVTGKHDGGFRNFAGELNVVAGHVADTGNRILIDMDSAWADNPDVTQHLKKTEFFEVPKYPTAEFVTTAIAPGTNGSTVTGNLQLHGITKQISFPATIQVSDNEVSVAAQFFIKRFDFDVKYKGMADDLVRDEVVLRLNVKAAPGNADFSKIEKLATAK